MRVCPQCAAEYPEEVDFCPKDGMKLRARRLESEDPLIGRALDGRWVIEEKLGEGGMGAVYKGHQQSVSRTVAIKTLRPQLVESEEFVDRFFREAKIAASISHPHCVTILDYGESDDGTLYLAMEFLDGELLTDRIESGSLTMKEVVEVGIQVASALSAAHEQNIVHRDLKPDNIFLLDVPGGGTFSKVLDFGIAKMLDSNTQVTKTGMIFGTPEYMSPEQCRGGKLDGRSDLYSLGCILYELVGGSTPFRATTPMAVLMAHVNEDVAPLRGAPVSSRVPDSLDHVIMKLLEKLPERRYQSASQLREALESVLAGLENPDAAAVSGSQEIVGDPVNIGFNDTMALADGSVETRRPNHTTGPQADTEPDTSRKGLMMIAAALLLSVVVLASVAFAIMSKPKDGPAPEATADSVAAAPDGTSAQEEQPIAAVAPDEPADEQEEEQPEEPSAEEETAEQPAEEPAEVAKATERKPRRRKAANKKTEPEPEEPSLEEIAEEMRRAQEAEKEASDSEPDTVATAEPKPEPKSEPEPKPRNRKGRERMKKINKKAEEIKNKALDNVLDGLMGE